MRLDFSVAIHSLLYIKQQAPKLVTSKELAVAMDINPVMIRTILSSLNKEGYIKGNVGKNGGYEITCELVNVNVGDLYDLLIPINLSYTKFSSVGVDLAFEKANGHPDDIKRTITDLFTLADQQYRAFYHQFNMGDIENDIENHGNLVKVFQQLQLQK